MESEAPRNIPKIQGQSFVRGIPIPELFEDSELTRKLSKFISIEVQTQVFKKVDELKSMASVQLDAAKGQK